jgi:hypothetical protein
VRGAGASLRRRLRGRIQQPEEALPLAPRFELFDIEVVPEEGPVWLVPVVGVFELMLPLVEVLPAVEPQG